MWDVGNFLLDPPSEQNNRDHREDEQENNKEETKKESKVNCLAHYYLSPLPIFFFFFFFTSPCISHSGKTWVRKPLVLLRHKLYEILPSVTSLERSVSRNVFVAASVAQSRIKVYFRQRLVQRKRCETCSLHEATSRVTSVATVQQKCETDCKKNCLV